MVRIYVNDIWLFTFRDGCRIPVLLYLSIEVRGKDFPVQFPLIKSGSHVYTGVTPSIKWPKITKNAADNRFK